MNIRIAAAEDRDDIHKVHLSAFSVEERAIVAKLAINLLSEKTTPPVLSLIAKSDSAVVGHIAFSPVKINHTNGQGYILAPLGVAPAYQNRSIGSRLIENGIQRLLKMEATILFVYGDPKFYGKFGFNAATASQYSPPYKIKYPFGWQGLILKNGHDIVTPAKITCVTSLSDQRLW